MYSIFDVSPDRKNREARNDVILFCFFRTVLVFVRRVRIFYRHGNKTDEMDDNDEMCPTESTNRNNARRSPRTRIGLHSLNVPVINRRS